MPELPVDLVDTLILDYLQHDHKALARVSLLCSYTRALAQRLLFSRLCVVIDVKPGTQPSMECLVSAPRLLHNVKDLEINVLLEDFPQWQSWVTAYGALFHHVLQLVQLGKPVQHLTFYAPDRFHDWATSTSPVLVGELEHIVASGSVRTHKMTGWPSSFFLRPLPALKYLNVPGLGHGPSNPSPFNALASLDLSMRNRDLEGSDRWTLDEDLTHESTGIHLNALQNLTISCSRPTDWKTSFRLLNLCQQSLANLFIKCKYSVNRPGGVLRLGTLSNLGEFKAMVVPLNPKFQEPSGDDSHLKWLLSELTDVKMLNLRRFVLFIVTVHGPWLDTRDIESLGVLASNLADKTYFPQLSRVEVYICTGDELHPRLSARCHKSLRREGVVEPIEGNAAVSKSIQEAMDPLGSGTLSIEWRRYAVNPWDC